MLKIQIFRRGLGVSPPSGIPPKTNSLNDLIYGAGVFDISIRYFGDDYFDIVWGCHPKTDPPKINCLIGSSKGTSYFLNISTYLREKCFDIIWKYPPPPASGTPKMDPPSTYFFVWLKLGRQFYILISTDTTDKYFDLVWECHFHSETPPSRWTPKINFLHDQTYDACVFHISAYFRGKFFDRVGAYHPQGLPKRTP